MLTTTKLKTSDIYVSKWYTIQKWNNKSEPNGITSITYLQTALSMFGKGSIITDIFLNHEHLE